MTYYSSIVTVLFLWGTLSDERTGLSFVYAAGPRQRSLSRVRVPWYLWPSFIISDLILPFSSPPATRGSVVGWGTMLQAGRSLVRILDEVDFLIYLILPVALRWSWGPLSLYQKWVPGIILGVKSGRHVGLTTLSPSMSPMSEMWEPQPLATLRASVACTGIVLPLPYVTYNWQGDGRGIWTSLHTGDWSLNYCLLVIWPRVGTQQKKHIRWPAMDVVRHRFCCCVRIL
jgi:hypothetical protein